MNELRNLIDRMAPDEAMAAITVIVKNLFPYVSEKSRMDFIFALTRDADRNSVPDLVHL